MTQINKQDGKTNVPSRNVNEFEKLETTSKTEFATMTIKS